jgi:hypothetical protein
MSAVVAGAFLLVAVFGAVEIVKGAAWLVRHTREGLRR